jgi:hypothetical protein
MALVVKFAFVYIILINILVTTSIKVGIIYGRR